MPELVFKLLVPEPILGTGRVLEPIVLPESMELLLELMAPDVPGLMREASVEGAEEADEADMGGAVLDVEGMVVVVSSVFLLQAPNASNAERAKVVATAGLSRHANISVSFQLLLEINRLTVSHPPI